MGTRDHFRFPPTEGNLTSYPGHFFSITGRQKIDLGASLEGKLELDIVFHLFF